MAENKKSVLLYCDIIHTVEELSDEEAGKLFKHYLRYINDLNPVAPDKLTQIVFEPIKQNLKRDLKKWVSSKENKSDAGALGNLKRWNEDLYNKVVNNEMEINEAVKIAKGRYAIKKSQAVAKVAVTDTVTVKDTVTVNEESKGKNLRTPDLSKSNLYRQPNIPTKEKVTEVFLRRGGNLEMANTFFEKNSATGWFSRGSPITNFENLVPSFITNWEQYATDKQNNSNRGLGSKSGGFGVLVDLEQELKRSS